MRVRAQSFSLDQPVSGIFSSSLSRINTLLNDESAAIFDPHVTEYSDEASVANGSGSNGESMLSVAAPQAMGETIDGIYSPRLDTTSSEARLSGDQRIFVNALMYHWHV